MSIRDWFTEANCLIDIPLSVFLELVEMGCGVSTHRGRLSSLYYCPLVLDSGESFSPLINEPLGDLTIFIDSSVTQERPPAAYFLTVVKVDINDDTFLIVVTGTIE